MSRHRHGDSGRVPRALPWRSRPLVRRAVQETLGLSSITVVADTYTSVLPRLARQSAEDVAALIRPAKATRRPRRPGRAAGTERGPLAARPEDPPGGLQELG
jgi:hypothetical protein